MNIPNDGGIPPEVARTDNLPNIDDEDSGGQTESFELSVFLSGIHYPATKEDILDYAQDQGLADEVQDMLEQIPEATYLSATEISQAIGENAEEGSD